MSGEPHQDDWADRLALEIALDMQRCSTRAACELVAARLRAVKAQGELKGAQETAQLVGLAMKHPSLRNAPSTLQDEYRRDVAELGADGWGGKQ